MSDPLRALLAIMHEGRKLRPNQLEAAFRTLLNGEASAAQIGAFLMGLERQTVDQAIITAGARAMRAAMTPVKANRPCIDVCGTGGDGAHSLNISTAVAFVLAGGGQVVAKHGNRAMSSQSGAADVLEALGVNLALSPIACAQALNEIGIAFLFAQVHHPAMVYVSSARKELGFKTIFNLLGPLSNPAGAQRQLIGVYSPHMSLPMAEALREMGSQSAWIVHGAGGLDEVSLSGASLVTALNDGAIETFEVHPNDLGLATVPVAALRGGNAHENAVQLLDLLKGQVGPYRDIVLLNAAAALCAVGATSELKVGYDMARTSLDQGHALAKLDALISFTTKNRA
ncbi:anthranilate phosphoribosyltransferase [Candidatus Phycosocius spiralis]|uniref:Anthranilate phosphoribosyltransferase n=1 Tax=Candidatus Phycosocius spiralis TaxID=2815099 RepID=A0ABQ4PT45_9PROT|nr:anthranilate phosphoribosyltransferase [Candidatus Phycosocius spiralis]GIU66162.1 anthranilate phosphoribosyltransferase [Candidatus Phycosocius spiralis]